MKKILSGIFAVIILAGSAWADTGPTEQDYKSLDQMRVKLIRMRREMDRFVKDVVGPYAADMDKGGMDIFGGDVRVDVTENDKDVVVKADLPGMSKDKIDITLEKNRILKISGSREIETKKESPGVVRQERMSGRFERLFELPAECENSGIKATYKEGVLEIVLPKKESAKEDVIKVGIQ
jgi:HSP20 family protein